MFFNFIWNGKTDRVKRSTLIADFSQGGLNMVHLQSFCTYLKLSWVKRFLSNSDGTWQNLLLAELKQLGGDRVFTLQKDKIKEISNRLKNPFWKDIFECLHMAKPYTKLCVPEILSLDILNFIPISEYPVYMKWKLYGIQFIRDIVDSQSKSLLTFQQVRQKLNLEKFLRYYSLLSNIPKYIKKYIKDYCDLNLENFVPFDAFSKRILENKKLKFVYRDLVDKICILPYEKFLKWEDVTNSEISEWSKYFSLLKRCCRDTYLKNFQYKILHRIIPTNTFLYRIKQKETSLCTFCNEEEETIEHLFYDCNVTYNFWLSFLQKIKLFDEHFSISKTEILLGFITKSLFINLLIIIAKNYIFRCKLRNIAPSFIGLKFRIKQYQSNEFYIANKNNRAASYERFWSPLHTIFS